MNSRRSSGDISSVIGITEESAPSMFFMNLEGHHQMVDHNLICFESISGLQSVQIFSVLIHSTLNPAFNSQSILGGELDQIKQTLKNLIKFIVFHVIDQKKMELVIVVDEGFQLIFLMECPFHTGKGLSQVVEKLTSFFCSNLQSDLIGAEALNRTADFDAVLHILFIQLSDHKSLAWNNRNIAILAQALKRFPHGGARDAQLL